MTYKSLALFRNTFSAEHALVVNRVIRSFGGWTKFTTNVNSIPERQPQLGHEQLFLFWRDYVRDEPLLRVYIRLHGTAAGFDRDEEVHYESMRKEIKLGVIAYLHTKAKKKTGNV